jgi:hypothetical protein
MDAKRHERSIHRLPKKRNEVNVVLAPITGGASVRVNPVYIELVEDASGVSAAAPASLPTATAVAGSVVKSIGSQVWREPAGSLWVVLKEGTRPDCVKIAKLGGKDNNYYANVPLKLLAAVSMAELPAALAEQAAL